jgi:hypothetical protein
MDGSGPAAIFPFHFDSLVMWGPSSTYTASYTFFSIIVTTMSRVNLLHYFSTTMTN